MRTLLPLLLLAGCTPSPDDSDGPSVLVDPDAASWSPPSFPPAEVARIVFLGDSITDGFGIRVAENQYTHLLQSNNDARWPEFSRDDLSERYGDIELINVSQDGSRTSDLPTIQIPNLRTRGPFPGHTVALFTVGGNDLVDALTSSSLNTVASRVEANIEATILELQATFPNGVSIAFTNIYEPTDGEGQTNACFFGLSVEAAEAPLVDTNERTLALAKEHGAAWVDLRGHFKGHGHNYNRETIAAYDPDDPTLWFQDDCIHPTQRGHHEIRRLFLAAIDNQPLELWTP